ncbi:MAG TPA: response regulator [Chloroflexi bacterium]|nr:response regulator [Chloroflexota bacterium]
MVERETSNWTVLIVEDEPDNLSVAEKVLTFYGAEVLTARDGMEGLEILKKVKPTFILMDLSMPKMDGWEMLKAVRANPKTAHLPVIALTAHAMAGDEKRVMEAGFDGYITKPFRLASFMDKIKACLHSWAEKTLREEWREL